MKRSGGADVFSDAKKPRAAGDAAPRPNSILAIANSSRLAPTSSSSRATCPPAQNVQFVAGSVINVDELLKNAPGAAPRTKRPESLAPKSEKQLLAEVDELLGKKSSHAKEADDEWIRDYSQRMNKLAQREYASSKDALETTSIRISAYSCTTCNHFLTELLPDLCTSKGHIVQKVRAVKRFYICNNCSRRDKTLTAAPEDERTKLHLPPKHRCHCGGYAWQACGMRGRAVLAASSADMRTSVAPEKLLTAAAEWTSRADRLAMAVRTDSLTAAPK